MRFLSHLLAAVFLGVMVHLAYAGSPQLVVSGNQILTASGGCTVQLKGVDFSGLEYNPTGDTGPGRPTTVINGVTMTDYVSIAAEAVSIWHANCIRLPLNQDFWFGCSNSDGTPHQAAYQGLIQALANYCSFNNAYLDLDLQYSGTASSASAPCGGAGWGTASGTQSMPDMNAVTFWSSVAAAYANNPAVLFDLYNEPFGVTWTAWRTGGATGGAPVSTPGLQALLTAIRGAGANNIVVAGGLDWAFDLRGVASGSTSCAGGNCGLTDTGTGMGVVYSAHCYDDKAGAPPTVGTVWDPYVTVATTTNAVIIEEFGAQASDPAGWDNSAIAWIEGGNSDSYVYSAMAWAFSPDDGPTLLTSYSGYPTTAYHGAPVSTWLNQLNITPTPTCFNPIPTFTPTPTATPTATFTFTPVPIVVYPNPMDFQHYPPYAHQCPSGPCLKISGVPLGATLSLYDLNLALVRVFAPSDPNVTPDAATGTALVTWDGNNGMSKPVVSGIYIYKIEGPGGRTFGKLAVSRSLNGP